MVCARGTQTLAVYRADNPAHDVALAQREKEAGG